jgi:hypothetical protein
MNDLPRQKLREIVRRHGVAVIENHRRCEGLLRDYCGGFRREVSVLVMALEEGVAAEMLAAPAGTARDVLMARMARRLCDHLALSEPAAMWSVDSWALALGLISDVELEAVERRRVGASVTAPASAKAGDGRKQARPVSGESIIVSAKGNGDYESIEDALKHAAPGARLLVRPGLYREGVIIDKQIVIMGDGPPEDIIISGSDSSSIQMRADQATVTGLTIRGRAAGGEGGFFAVDIARGRLVLDGCDISSDTLSCVAVHGTAADPVIRRCRIHDGADSGVYFFDGATGTLEECEVYGNANVGIAITGRAAPLIRGSRMYGGKNAGIVAWKEGQGLIESCEVYGNRLAGIGISEGGNMVVRSSRIHEGENSGVFVHHGGEGRLEDCDLFGHSEAEVAVTTQGKLALRECIIHHGKNSGVFVREEGQALLEECHINNNADSGLLVGMGALVVVRKCHINQNGQFAIKVYEGGAVSAEDSDLTRNLTGPWDLEDGAIADSKSNRE